MPYRFLCLDSHNISNDMMCADVLEEGSLCIGDGGGPLVAKNSIVSILQHSVHSALNFGVAHILQSVQYNTKDPCLS